MVSPDTAASHRGAAAIGTSVRPQRPCPRTPAASSVSAKITLMCSLTPAQSPSLTSAPTRSARREAAGICVGQRRSRSCLKGEVPSSRTRLPGLATTRPVPRHRTRFSRPFVASEPGCRRQALVSWVLFRRVQLLALLLDGSFGEEKYDQNWVNFLQPPREGGLLRRLGARSRCFCCLDPIPPTEGGGVQKRTPLPVRSRASDLGAAGCISI